MPSQPPFTMFLKSALITKLTSIVTSNLSWPTTEQDHTSMEKPIRISTASRMLKLSTYTINRYKRDKLVSDPGRSLCLFSEVEAVFKQNLRTKLVHNLGPATSREPKKKKEGHGPDQIVAIAASINKHPLILWT